MPMRASCLLGAGVMDRDGRDLGRISDLIFDSQGPGRMCYVVISVRTPRRLEEQRTVALPWSLVQTPSIAGDKAVASVRVDLPRSALERLRDNPLLQA